MDNYYLLSSLIFLPVMASLVLLLFPKGWGNAHKWVALLVGVIQLILIVPVFLHFDPNLTGVNSVEGFQWTEYHPWIRLDLGSFGILAADYFVGLDGLNIWLVVLSVVILLIAVIASWKIEDRSKGYFSLFLLLNGSIIGCFTALDFLLFYVFFEFMLLPMFFLIGLWGGPRREYASIKFFLYTLLGSVLILIVMIMLYLSVTDPVATGLQMDMAGADVSTVQQMVAQNRIPSESVVHTFNMVLMTDPANLVPGSILHPAEVTTVWGMPIRLFAFLLLFIGFSIKIPIVPVHTWLPDAHVEAPTAISVILAGILLKVGAYGLIRAGYLVFPDAAMHFAWLIALLGVISIVYGAMNALASKDLKRLIAYSSVSHMGFVVLGLASNTAEGIGGAIYQLVSHGVISAALFLIVGVIYDRTHDRIIQNYSGLASKLPAFTVISIIFFFASLGLPGMSGFIAEILVLLGAFASGISNGLVNRWMAVAAVSGLVLSAAYYLWTLQRMYFGAYFVRNFEGDLNDLTGREYLMLIPLVIFTILLGLFPFLLLDWMNPAINLMIEVVETHGLNLLNSLPG